MAISTAAIVAYVGSAVEAVGAYAGAAGAGSAAAGAGASAGTVVADAALTDTVLATAGTAGTTTATAAAGSSILPYLAYGGTALSAVGGVTGAIGAKQTADAQAEAAKYNAAVQAQNATQANANANIAAQSGEAQFGIQSQRGRANVGAILAEQGASGIDPYTGSARSVRQSASDLSQLNALTVRSNAIRTAYGYQTEGASEKGQSQVSSAEASNEKKAGDINAASTFLGGVGSATDKYSNWQLTSGKSLFVG